MIQGKFFQTALGNVTVLALGEVSLLLWIDGVSYLLTNPNTTHHGYIDKIGVLDFDEKDTPDLIKAKIDAHIKGNK